MAPEAGGWQELSVFDALETSWNENLGGESRSRQGTPLVERDIQTRKGSAENGDRKEEHPLSSTASSSNGSSGTANASRNDSLASNVKDTLYKRDAAFPTIHVAKKRKGKAGGSGVMTDSELLDPAPSGPSGPSMRVLSHKRSASDEVVGPKQGTEQQDEGEREVQEQDAVLSPPLSARSKLSTSSEEKRGSHTSHSVTDDKEDPLEEDEEDQFGSAREDQSTSQAVNGMADATCIEYSNVESLPDELGPEWKRKAKGGKFAGKDLLNKPKSQLRTMFEGMYEAREAALASPEAGPRPQPGKESVQEVATHTEVQPIESQVNSAEEDLVEEAIVDEGQDGEEDLERGVVIDGENRNHPDEGWEDIEHAQDPSNERDERETEQLLAQVPQCTFTFSSPVIQNQHLNPPATPSNSHGLLRLLPQGAQRAEIEQILNTPRSERKSGQAYKLIAKLVEQDRGERERKRLRVDQRLRRSTSQSPQSPADGLLPAQSPRRLGRDYVRDAPAFMERLRNVRLPSESSGRSNVSSLIVNRRGAKAPTPESSLLRGRPTASPLLKERSPRKLLRMWSAANQVDEEIEKERRAEEDEWQDLPEHSPASPVSPVGVASIPIVSVDPPTQRGLENIVSGARETQQRGMLHISPEDVDVEAMEHMAHGRMTFDRNMGKWVPARGHKQPSNDRNESDEDSSDPFKDIETLASQSMVRNAQLHAPRSQSALRNEVQMSESSTTMTSHLSEPSSSQRSSPRDNLLSAPKTPQPLSTTHLSPTPRSILKTGRSLLAGNAHSPSPSRPENRSISFADGAHFASQQRVEKVEDLLRQLAELALGPDDTVDEIQSRHQTPTRKIDFAPSGSMRTRSPWSLSVLKNRGNRADDDAGNASFLTNASFNVAHDRILELITDVAPWEPGWLELKRIDLRKRRVDSLVRLKEFLPSLEEAILDDNEITYLTGLPSSVRLLSVASNRLPPTVSFGHLINLESLDISCNHVDDSLMSLSKLVHLRHLRAESNGICSLEGLEQLSKLESLNLRANKLQAVNIDSHQWPLLKDLTLSHNEIVTIRGLSHLKHLRSLNLDHNSLSRFETGGRMTRLKQLRLSGNIHLTSLDVGSTTNVRTLYADDCSLSEVQNLKFLEKLDNLSLRQQNGDGPGINWPAHQTRDIKRLFLSGNAFRSIDLTSRTPLGTAAPMTRFYSMVYLELSACQLASLPLDLSDLVPNLRHLNADYNLLESLPMLNGLHRLKRLSIVGCRISKSRKIVESLEGCEELAVLDVRMNPCTLGLYPPFLLTAPAVGKPFNKAFLPPNPNPDFAWPDRQADGNPRHDGFSASSSEPMHQSFFHKREPGPDLCSTTSVAIQREKESAAQRNSALFVTSDNRFSRTLPPQFRLQRLLHRGVVAMACPSLTWLDGLLVDEEEVRQADDYFQKRLGSHTSDPLSSSSEGSFL